MRVGFGSWGNILTLVALVGLALVSFSSDAKSDRRSRDDRDERDHDRGGRKHLVFSVTHGEVQTLLTTLGSNGHSLGDLRVLPATPIYDEKDQLVGRLDATLTTSSVDIPAVGDEIRMSVLNFIFGVGDQQFAGSSNQIIVSGSGFYPGDQSTIATGTSLVRPVTGGSGEFHGATGSALTDHLPDGTWIHTFDIVLP